MRKSPSSNRSKFKNFRHSDFTKQRRSSQQELSETPISNTQDKVPNVRKRLFIVWGVLIAAGLGLAINLYQLQIVRGGKLTQRARSQQMVDLRPFMPRRPVPANGGFKTFYAASPGHRSQQ